MTKITLDPLTVIGAGPAGIMAAYTAAEAGVQVTLLDDNAHPGGQYYRQSPPEFDIDDQVASYSGRPEAASLYAKLQHPKIKTIYGMLVWGVFDKRMLALADRDRTYLLQADRVILATGAYDRPLAFPGWTLPGVYGAGATLRMVKTQWLLPGKRFLLAGLGPLQLALAASLLELNAELVCVAEAANPLRGWPHLPGLIGHWDRLREAYGYIRVLRQHRVPLLFNHAIVEVEGDDYVETATIAHLDNQGVPIRGSERKYEVDAVCLGYGFLPSFQLAAAFGCDLHYDQNLHWYVPLHDANMETTETGVFVAGDLTDMGGAQVAMAEGRVAGLVAAHQLGALDSLTFERRLAKAQASLRPLNRLALALQRIYSFRPSLAFPARDDTLVCRCEEVTYGMVKEAISRGATDLHQVKLHTRGGMGYCQGRFCSSIIAQIIASSTGQAPAVLPPFTVRPPIQPLPIGVLAAGAEFEQSK